MELNNEILKEVEKIRTILRKNSKIVYAILFGSYLTRPETANDIDLLIGGELTFEDRVDISSSLEILLKRKVDLVFSREASIGLVLHAFSTGYRILVKDEDILKKDYLRIFYANDDIKNLSKIKDARLKRRFSNGK